MERKTKIIAEDGRLDLLILREFELPVELLFRAYTDPEIVEQWMSTKVLKLENHKYGGWQFETSNAEGIVVFRANGVIHDIIPNEKIIRTFEMENAPFGVQLEHLVFEKLTADTSKLSMQSIYKSVELRDQMLKLPFAYGINMAHDKLQKIANHLK